MDEDNDYIEDLEDELEKEEEDKHETCPFC